MSRRRITIAAILLSSVLLLCGCEEYFDYSPYGIETTQHQLTAINIARVEESSSNSFVPFKFAVASDTHAYYDEMKALVQMLNGRNDLAFLLIAGDTTDYGLQQEYLWSTELLAPLKIPYLTVIGNHDSLNNGKENYQAFFGPFDYSFVFNQVKFVALNSNSWEFDDRVPRLDWLRAQLSDFALYRHQIVLTHILPYNSRFNVMLSQSYAAALEENFVSFVAGGHDHAQAYREVILSNGQTIGYLATGTLKDRRFVVVTVETDRVSYVTETF